MANGPRTGKTVHIVAALSDLKSLVEHRKTRRSSVTSIHVVLAGAPHSTGWQPPSRNLRKQLP
eukprot:5938726-Amphidinium_carterae.1